MQRLLRLMAAYVALIPSPRQARRSSPRPGRSTLTTSAPRSAMSVAQYGPAMTRERSRTRTPASMPGGSATVEEAVRHRVHRRDARPGDRVDARLDLRERPERLRRQRRGVGTHLVEQAVAGHRAMHEPEPLRLGRRVAAALHDDLLGARRAHEPHEPRGGGDAERDAEVDLG